MDGIQGKIDRKGVLYYDRAELTSYVTDLQLRMEKELGRNNAQVRLTKAVDGSLVFWINGEVVARERPDMEDAINSEDVNIYRNLAGGVTQVQILHAEGDQQLFRKFGQRLIQ